MKRRIFVVVAAAAWMVAAIAAQQSAPATSSGNPTRRPDLSGTWAIALGVNGGTALRREVNGSVSTRRLDRADLQGIVGISQRALPWTDAPSYKPEFQEKVKYLFDHESKVDPVFYCGRPGVPRIGPPRRIIQLPTEVVFLYEDMSGDTYRVIPTDGRAHNADANPSYYGDSVGKWEGDTLVVEARNFVEDTWFGEDGYFHTDALRVVERLWREGENLGYQVTVHEPNVLTASWTMTPRVIRRSTRALEESPRCIEQDGPLLRNDDHHGQR